MTDSVLLDRTAAWRAELDLLEEELLREYEQHYNDYLRVPTIRASWDDGGS